LTTHLQQHQFRDRPWLFPQLLDIVRRWLGDPDGITNYFAQLMRNPQAAPAQQ